MPSQDPGGGDASTVVSYLLFVGGGAVLGFLMALCAIGRGGRHGHIGSDLEHGLIIAALTLGGAASGGLAVYRTLSQKRKRR